MRGVVAATLAAVLLLALAVFAWWPAPPPAVAVAAPAALTAPGAVAAPSAASLALPAAAPQAPSWRGTDSDGAIHLDAQGRLLPDLALRRLFDYLLTAQGELTLAQIRERLAATGRAQALDATQQMELASLFQRYLDYLQALTTVRLQDTDAEGLRRTADARKTLRRGVLGLAMAEGFFAADEARERYEIELTALRQNTALDPAARAAALAALQREAPADVQAIARQSAEITALTTETERLQAGGADAATVQALRERTVGAEAAGRLAALDAERAAWQQRVAAFAAERERLLRNTAFALDDQQRQVEALINRDFSEVEAVRLRAQLGMSAAP